MKCIKRECRKNAKRARAALAALLCAVMLLAGCTSGGPRPEDIAPATYAPQSDMEVTPAPTELVAPAQPVQPQDEVAADPLADAGETPAPGETAGPQLDGDAQDDVQDGVQDDVPEDGQDAPVQPTVSLEKGEINIGLVLENEAVLHPLKTTHRDLISMNEMVFESVIELDDDMQPVGELADTWSVSGNTYVFHLRSNIQFHNGEALCAQDVLETYQYIKNYGSAGPWYERVSMIQDMAAVDESTLSVTFANSGFTSLYAMTFPVVQRYTLDYAMPKGTGPYWYAAYAVNQCLRLESNPLWWKKEAKVHSVVGWRYPDTQSALEALAAGDIDTLATRSTNAALYKKLTDYNVSDYPTSIYELLVPNLTSGAMTDVRMRRAIMYGIDRTAIASVVYSGLVQESEVPVVPGTYLYETQAAQYNYSPERALQILHEIGWYDSNSDGMLDTEVDGLLENFTIRLVTYNDNLTESRSNVAYQIADQLKKVGITVEITVTTNDKMTKTFKSGDFDIALIGVNLSYVPDLTELLRHDGDLNFSGYASKEMNNLLVSARSAGTADELKSIYSEIQLKVVEELPILGMYFHTGAMISGHDISGLHGIYELNTWNGMELVSP